MSPAEEALSRRPEAAPFRAGGRAMVWGLIAGLVGGVLLVIGLFVDPAQTAFSYLIAYAYLFALVMGAAAFVTSMHAASAIWPTAVRRLAEALIALLPLCVVLLVPVFVGANRLYPWMHPDTLVSEHLRQVVMHKRGYLNLPFTAARAAIYFIFFFAVAWPLRRWSRRMDSPDPPAALRLRMRVLSSVALPGMGIFGTMAAWDWLMSLSPDWYSTMFGLYYLAGGFVTALAAISLLAALSQRAGLLPGIQGSHFYALGRLMFAFLIFWAYTAYFQYMLSWIANRPVEAGWFAPRTRGAYAWVGLFIIFGHFGLPFLVLLSYWLKRRASGIAAVSIWLLAAHYFDVHWIVAAARGRPNPFSWQDLGAVLFVGGLSVAYGLYRQRGVPLAPVFDPTFELALGYSSR